MCLNCVTSFKKTEVICISTVYPLYFHCIPSRFPVFSIVFSVYIHSIFSDSFLFFSRPEGLQGPDGLEVHGEMNWQQNTGNRWLRYWMVWYICILTKIFSKCLFLNIWIFQFIKFCIFKASALWADAFYKSKYPYVCLFVCLFTFKVPFNGLFAPTSLSWMSNIFRDSEN